MSSDYTQSSQTFWPQNYNKPQYWSLFVTENIFPMEVEVYSASGNLVFLIVYTFLTLPAM